MKSFVHAFERHTKSRNIPLRRFVNTIQGGNQSCMRYHDLIQLLEGMPKHDTTRMTFYDTPISFQNRLVYPIDILKFHIMSKETINKLIRESIRADISHLPNEPWMDELRVFLDTHLTVCK